MQQQSNGTLPNGTIARQMSSSSTASSGGHQQHQQQMSPATPSQSGVVFEVFVDTPMTRGLMQGPLNIQLPPIQLPSGLQSLVGQFTNAGGGAGDGPNQLQRQASMAIGDGVAALSAHHQQQTPIQSTPGLHPQMDIPDEPSPLNISAASPPTTASSPISWGRASSTPAAMNSNSSGSGESFVIEMGGEEHGTGNSHIHRRRSSSPPLSCAIRHHSSNPSDNTQLTQRSVQTAANATDVGVGTCSTVRTTTSTTTGNTGDGAGSEDNNNNNEPTLRNLRARLQEALRQRHQIARGVLEHTGEFPSLYVLSVVLCWLLVLAFVLIQFFAFEFTACLALLFCLFHYSDVVAFKRYISGTGSICFIAAKVALRQFMVLHVLGQSIFVFPAALLQEVALSAVQTPTFWSTLYIVFLAEYFCMDCLLGAKILISTLPKCSQMYKRRLYQWLEYTAGLYRFAIPFVQWNAYLGAGAIWWTVLYGGLKILLCFAMAWAWLLTTMRIFRATHLGSAPTEAECKQHEQCTICFSEFASPIKLKCAHIFCSECIRTWLDREHTCPICRAVVTKEDNNYRNGESMFPALF